MGIEPRSDLTWMLVSASFCLSAKHTHQSSRMERNCHEEVVARQGAWLQVETWLRM